MTACNFCWLKINIAVTYPFSNLENLSLVVAPYFFLYNQTVWDQYVDKQRNLMESTSHFQNHSSSCGQDFYVIFVPHSTLCIHLSYLSVLERWFKPKFNYHSSISHLIYKSAFYYSHRMQPLPLGIYYNGKFFLILTLVTNQVPVKVREDWGCGSD